MVCVCVIRCHVLSVTAAGVSSSWPVTYHSSDWALIWWPWHTTSPLWCCRLHTHSPLHHCCVNSHTACCTTQNLWVGCHYITWSVDGLSSLCLITLLLGLWICKVTHCKQEICELEWQYCCVPILCCSTICIVRLFRHLFVPLFSSPHYARCDWNHLESHITLSEVCDTQEVCCQCLTA